MIFVILAVLLDFTCGHFLKYLYFKQKSGYNYRTTYAIENTNQPGLIFGSSRANHHYATTELSDSFQMPFYNVGRDGQSILYDYALLQSILKRYTPKMILLDYQDEELLYFANSYERLSSLLPYAKAHPEIKQILQKRSGFEKLKMISQVYPYNSLFFSIIGGMSSVAGKEDDINGYLPIDHSFHSLNFDRNGFLSKMETDSNKIAAFDSFLNLCKEKGIELYVIMSPYYDSVSEYLKHPIHEEIGKEGVAGFDYSHFAPIWGRKEFFSDEKHLNRQGSVIFTRDLISRIRAYRQTGGTEGAIPKQENLISYAGISDGEKPGRDTVNLIVIQGESNASGMGLNSQATAQEKSPRNKVKIINNNTLLLESLELGVNNNIKSNLPNQTTHGFENGLADEADSGHLTHPVFLVKAAGSGSRIGEWLPDSISANPVVYGWSQMVLRMDAALKYLNSRHIPYRITVWQSIGINDYNAHTTNADFQARMIEFREDFRQRYGKNIPFLTTHFFPSHPYNAVIDAIVQSDPLHISRAIDITGATYREPNVHWDYRGLKLIAKRMADQMNATPAEKPLALKHAGSKKSI